MSSGCLSGPWWETWTRWINGHGVKSWIRGNFLHPQICTSKHSLREWNYNAMQKKSVWPKLKGLFQQFWNPVSYNKLLCCVLAHEKLSNSQIRWKNSRFWFWCVSALHHTHPPCKELIAELFMLGYLAASLALQNFFTKFYAQPNLMWDIPTESFRIYFMLSLVEDGHLQKAVSN